MKIMVCLKQVPHQDARLDIDGDGTWIKEDNIKFEINTYDTYALEEALRIKDEGEAEVVVVSIGPDRVTQALRTALGMGADRAIHVKDPETDGSDALGVAKILAAIAKEESPDLIVDMATLTGAARVALGPELPALFSDDDDLARQLVDVCMAEEDPVWHMPLWAPYSAPIVFHEAAPLYRSGNL